MARKKAIREEYYIGIQGQSIPVSEDVYYAFYGGQRQENYQEERDKQFGVKPFSDYGSKEENILDLIPSETNIEEEVCKKIMIEQLYEALQQLEDDEQDLIQMIFFDRVPLTQIAHSSGIAEGTVRYRKNQILDKLRKYF